MNKESISTNSYPLGETYFTRYKTTPASLRDPHSGGPSEEQDLASRHRISHPIVSEKLTTTSGQPNKDPENGLRWSRNMLVARAERKTADDLDWFDADEINTKLRRDAEEIDLSIDALDTIQDALAKVESEQATAKRRHRKALAQKAFNLVQDINYLQNRTDWISGYSHYKEKGEPFDAKTVVNTHDIIGKRILKSVRRDGSTPMDDLHEQAITMARKDGVELNIDKPIK